MARRLESSAMIGRMHQVGKALDKSAINITKAKINEWLDDNEDVCERLFQLMENGLAREMLFTCGHKLPRSCTRFGLISAAIKQQHLKRRNSDLNTMRLKTMKKVDPKIVEKLFGFDLNAGKMYPMKGGMGLDEFKELTTARLDVIGPRLPKLTIEDDGAINWLKNGVYAFAKVGEDGAKTFLDASELEQTTHIVHKPSGFKLLLEKFDMQKIGVGWSLVENWDENKAVAYNGKRLRVELLTEFKTHNPAWFDYDTRLKAHESGESYFANFGEDMAKSRMEERATAKEMIADTKQQVADAGMSSAVAPTSGSTKRKKRRIGS